MDAIDLAFRTSMDTGGLAAGAAKATGILKGLSSGIGGLVTGLGMAGLAFQTLSSTGKAAFSALAGTAAGFQQSMANVASVTGGGVESLNKLTEAARAAGAATVFSASQAADAMYYLASAGQTDEQIVQSLGSTLNLAAAGMMDLGSASEMVTSTIAQFKLQADDAGRVSNAMAAAASFTNTTIGQLGMGLGYVGPVAASLGFSLEDTTAALGLLANAGLKGERGGTALRGALSALMKPSTAAAAALGEMGLTIEDVDPATHKLVDIVGALEKGSMTAAQSVAIFGQEAGPSMLALVSQGSTALDEMTEKITGTNKAAEMAATQTETFQGAMKMLGSAMEELQIAAGNEFLPGLTAGVQAATEAVRLLGENMDTLTDAAKNTGSSLKDAFSGIGEDTGGIDKAIGEALSGGKETRGLVGSFLDDVSTGLVKWTHRTANDVNIGETWFGSQGDVDAAKQKGTLVGDAYVEASLELMKSKAGFIHEESIRATSFGDVKQLWGDEGSLKQLITGQAITVEVDADTAAMDNAVSDSLNKITQMQKKVVDKEGKESWMPIEDKDVVKMAQTVTNAYTQVGADAKTLLDPMIQGWQNNTVEVENFGQSVIDLESNMDKVVDISTKLGDEATPALTKITEAFSSGNADKISEAQELLEQMSETVNILGDSFEPIAGSLEEAFSENKLPVEEFTDVLNDMAFASGRVSDEVMSDLGNISSAMDSQDAANMWDVISESAKLYGPQASEKIAEAIAASGDPAAEGFTETLAANLGVNMEEALTAPMVDSSEEAGAAGGEAAADAWLERFISGMDYNLKHGYSYIWENGEIAGVEEETPEPLWKDRYESITGVNVVTDAVIGHIETEAYKNDKAAWEARQAGADQAYEEAKEAFYQRTKSFSWKYFDTYGDTEEDHRRRAYEIFEAGYHPGLGGTGKENKPDEWKERYIGKEPASEDKAGYQEEVLGTEISYSLAGKERTAQSIDELLQDINNITNDEAATYGYVNQILSGQVVPPEFLEDIDLAKYSLEEMQTAMYNFENQDEIRVKHELFDQWVDSLPTELQSIKRFGEDFQKTLFDIWHVYDQEGNDTGLAGMIKGMMESGNEEIEAKGQNLKDAFYGVLEGLADPTDMDIERFDMLNNFLDVLIEAGVKESEIAGIRQIFADAFEAANLQDLIIDPDAYRDHIVKTTQEALNDAQLSIRDTGMLSQDWIDDQIKIWEDMGDDSLVSLLKALKGDESQWDKVKDYYREKGYDVSGAFLEGYGKIPQTIQNLNKSLFWESWGDLEERLPDLGDVFYELADGMHVIGESEEELAINTDAVASAFETLTHQTDHSERSVAAAYAVMNEFTDLPPGIIEALFRPFEEGINYVNASAESIDNWGKTVDESLAGACGAMSNFAKWQENPANNMFSPSFIGGQPGDYMKFGVLKDLDQLSHDIEFKFRVSGFDTENEEVLGLLLEFHRLQELAAVLNIEIPNYEETVGLYDMIYGPTPLQEALAGDTTEPLDITIIPHLTEDEELFTGMEVPIIPRVVEDEDIFIGMEVPIIPHVVEDEDIFIGMEVPIIPHVVEDEDLFTGLELPIIPYLSEDAKTEIDVEVNARADEGGKMILEASQRLHDTLLSFKIDIIVFGITMNTAGEYILKNAQEFSDIVVKAANQHSELVRSSADYLYFMVVEAAILFYEIVTGHNASQAGNDGGCLTCGTGPMIPPGATGPIGGFAEGGLQWSSTVTRFAEKEPEFAVPWSKVGEFVSYAFPNDEKRNSKQVVVNIGSIVKVEGDVTDGVEEKIESMYDNAMDEISTEIARRIANKW